MTSRGSAIGLLALFLSLAPVHAQTGWQAADPAHALDDDNPSSAQALQFGDQLQNKGFHQFCDNIPLDVNYSKNDGLFTSGEKGTTGFLAGGEAGVSRSFYHYPTGDLALIDRAAVKLSMGYVRKLLPSDRAIPLGLFLGSRVEGESYVIRPLDKNRSCAEIGKLLKLTDFKTVLPLSAPRVAAMKVGELWKFPLQIQVGIGPESGYFPAGPAFNAGFTAALTHSKARGAMATLYRMDARTVRLRLRFDRVEMWDLAGNAVASPLPIILAGTPEMGNVLKRVMPRVFAGFVADQVADYLNRYLAAIVNVSPFSHSDGTQVVLEYLIDPEDGERMKGLEQALKGDLGPLTLLTALVSLSRPSGHGDQAALEFLQKLDDENSGRIGQTPNYAGVDHKSKRTGLHLRVKLPALVDYDRSSRRVKDNIVTLGANDNGLRQWGADRQSSRSLFDIPFLGQYQRSQALRGVQASVKVGADDSISAPVVVYTQQAGFLRGDENSVRRLVEKANDVARFMTEDELPLPSAKERGAKGGRYTGNAALTVVLSEKAVQEILHASPAEIARAYARTLKGAARQAMDAVLASARFKDGRMIDPAAVFPGGGPMAQLAEELSAHALGLVKDLGETAQMSDPSRQAQRFVEILSGRGKSGLAYEAAIKVVAQLVSPGDLAGEFWVFLVDRTGSGKSSASRYLLNPQVFDDPLLKESSRANRRFMRPLQPTD